MVVRGAEWQPQGGGTAPDIQIPEGGITSVEYGFINGAGRYYRGADLGLSSRFLTDNAGDFFVGLSIAYVDDERRSDTPGDPFISIMNQERRLRSRSYLSLSWTKNDWAAGISTQRIGSMNYQSSLLQLQVVMEESKLTLTMTLVHLLDMILMKDISLQYQYQT